MNAAFHEVNRIRELILALQAEYNFSQAAVAVFIGTPLYRIKRVQARRPLREVTLWRLQRDIEAAAQRLKEVRFEREINKALGD